MAEKSRGSTTRRGTAPPSGRIVIIKDGRFIRGGAGPRRE